MKPNELRRCEPMSCRPRTGNLTQELFNLTFQLHTGRLENTCQADDYPQGYCQDQYHTPREKGIGSNR